MIYSRSQIIIRKCKMLSRHFAGLSYPCSSPFVIYRRAGEVYQGVGRGFGEAGTQGSLAIQNLPPFARLSEREKSF